MNEIKFFKKVFIVLLLGMLTVFILGNRSYAAEGGLDITNLQDVEVLSSSSSSSSSSSTTSTTKTTTANTTTGTTTTKQTNSSSKESSLPATGSNTEIIFMVGGLSLVIFVVRLYKKSSIKLK